MIVYGDPRFGIEAKEFIQHLERQTALIHWDNLDAARSVLIQCGQFEQGIMDQYEEQNKSLIQSRVQTVTDSASTLFYALLFDACRKLPEPRYEIRTALDHLQSALQQVQDINNVSLQIKVPEGFEFYTLYPEQYCFAACKWCSHHVSVPPRKKAVVIGLRSIGTSLSALVATTLEVVGWETLRFTVRPRGNPFEREANIPDIDLTDIAQVLIVDEGPGISGSSLTAVVQVLLEKSFPLECITLFPGHAGEPGCFASPRVRSIWSSIPKQIVTLDELHWNNRSLPELLTSKSEEMFHPAVFDGIEDLSAGLWRRHAYPNASEWPCICLTFERTKYLCSASGSLAIIWKFIGLGSLNEKCSNSYDLVRRSQVGPTKNLHLPVLGLFNGFMALPWIGGRRLLCSDASNPLILGTIAQHIIASSIPSQSEERNAAEITRLGQMLQGNTMESLGERYAHCINRSIGVALNQSPGLNYGDGHLGPHEWIQTPQGALFKVDNFGHRIDHTIVGTQSILWDIAGATIEWKMNRITSAAFYSIIESAGVAIPPDALTFYRMAYAAFRLGQISLCRTSTTSETWELIHSQHAATYHREYLAHELELQTSETG